MPPPPPPSCPNASRRWTFSTFRHSSHLLHLPRVQMRAGGGFRRRCHLLHLPHVQTQAGGGISRPFDTPPTTSTSLAYKCEPEVDFLEMRAGGGVFSFDTHRSHPANLSPPPRDVGGFNAAATSIKSKCEPEGISYLFWYLCLLLYPLHLYAWRCWSFWRYRRCCQLLVLFIGC